MPDPDPMLEERVRSLLRQHPLIDGHNGLPWAIRQDAEPFRWSSRLPDARLAIQAPIRPSHESPRRSQADGERGS